jgi:hypothetical protein
MDSQGGRSTLPPMDPMTAVPASIAAGEDWSLKITSSDYPPAVSRKCYLYLSGLTAKKLEFAASGTSWLLTVKQADTAAMLQGTYRYRIVIEDGDQATTGNAYTLDRGEVDVQADIRALASGALLDFDERILAAIEARMEGRITVDQEVLHIDGNEIARIPFEQLDALHTRYELKVRMKRDPASCFGQVVYSFPPIQ